MKNVKRWSNVEKAIRLIQKEFRVLKADTFKRRKALVRKQFSTIEVLCQRTVEAYLSPIPRRKGSDGK